MSLCENDTPINWKRNLIVAWLGCFRTGAAFSLVMPFLPLYVQQPGVTGHTALNMWSGIVFSITFLFSAIASPFWGGLADRKGRKIMLLRSALGMGIVMVLMGLAQNIWQFLILRALLGLLGGFVPNANALIATQVPRNKSGWALGTLSTGGVSGALLGPMAGGLLADNYGLRPVFFITASVLMLCFFVTLFCIREKFQPVSKKEMLHMREVVTSLKNPKLVLSLFVTTLIIQIATGSIAPILTLYVRELAGNVSNIAFISGMIASVPGVAALLSAPRLGKLGDRIGPEKILITALIFSVLGADLLTLHEELNLSNTYCNVKKRIAKVKFLVQCQKINSSTEKISAVIRIFSGPIRSPSLPSRGALSSAATPGTEAIIPLIKAMFTDVSCQFADIQRQDWRDRSSSNLDNQCCDKQAKYQFRVFKRCHDFPHV